MKVSETEGVIMPPSNKLLKAKLRLIYHCACLVVITQAPAIQRGNGLLRAN